MSQEGTQQAFGGCIDANSDNKTEASLLAAKFAEDHYDEVFRYCARRLPSREDAQDATQEVFLRLVKSQALYERNGKPLAYLYTCARNACSDFYRKAVSLDPLLDIERENIPDTHTSDNFERMSIADAIGHLAPKEQEVIELRYGQDLSMADIAQILGVSRFTVHRICKRALRSLEGVLGGE